MKNSFKKAVVWLLCCGLLLEGLAGRLGNETVWGASLPITRIDADQILDAKYQWQARFLSGKTTAREIRCDNVYREQFLKGPRGDWGSEATAGVASLPVGDQAFSREEAPGCYYSNVGQIEMADGSVHTMDLQILIMASYGGENRYDYRTPSLTTTNPQLQSSSSSLSNITYSWEKEMGRPCVSFMKNSIGLRIYCVDGVDVEFTYIDHQTGQPLKVSGHGTLSDIDGLQSVGFPEDCNIRQVYLLRESEGHLDINGSSVESGSASLSSDSRKGDITYLFEDTSSVKIHFSYKKSLENMTENYEKALADAGGDKETLAERMKKAYYGSNGETLMEHYHGEKWVTSHASFSYTSKVVGRFVEEPSDGLAKKIGPAGCSWEEAQTASREEPYWLKGQEAFDYLVQYALAPAVLQEFTLEDVLEEGLVIDGIHSVTIYDKADTEVTGQFQVSIEDGRKITCKALKSSMEEEPFSEHQVYTFRFRVHLQGTDRLTFEPDNYTYLLPNTATLRLRYEGVSGKVEEKTCVSNEVWAGGRITPVLQVEKRASRYEWRVGERVDYTVKVTQRKQNAWAQDLVISDTDIPDGLQLLDGFTVEEPSPTEHFVIAREGDNGWKCTGPILQYDESVIIHFQCLATEDANGGEWQNYVYATAENYVDEVTGEPLAPAFAREEIWVNSPELTVEKSASHYEWKVGEEVEYTVTLGSTVQGTLARNVILRDEMLPEGLMLVQGAGGIRIEGLPQEAAIPSRDDKTGINLSHREPVTAQIEAGESGWQVQISYLPAPAVVQVHFRCLVTGDVQGSTPEAMEAPGNGRRLGNEVTAVCEEFPQGETVKDREEIYVNTAWLTVDKQADHYEWQVGEPVLYQVTVENQYPGTIARNLVVTDLELPQGLELTEGEDAITIQGIPEVILQPVKDPEEGRAEEEKTVSYELLREETGWKLTVSDLPSGCPVTLSFSCMARETINGQEAVNVASVWADNGELRQDDARIYVNTAILKLDKTVINLYAAGQEQDKQDGRLNQEFRTGEEVIYQVTVENLQPGSIARNLVVEDTSLPEYLTLCDPSEIIIEGIPEAIQEPAEVTEDVPNETNPQYYGETQTKEVASLLSMEEGGWKLTVSDLPSGYPVTITYRCAVTEEANGKEIINVARSWSGNSETVEDAEKIWINTPKLTITKQSDKGTYLVGDTQTYTIHAAQTAVGCVARSVIIEDIVATEGAKLSKSTVVALDQERQVFDCETEIQENAFAVVTGKNLVAEGSYSIWDGHSRQEYPQTVWNPLLEDRETRLFVEYAVELTDTDLAGKTVENKARVTSLEGYPEETVCQTQVLAPELRVYKESDKKEYYVGEVVYFHIRVEQIREQAVARDIWLEDTWQETGLELVPESILVAVDQKRLEDARITAAEQSFRIETGTDLAEGQQMDVYYQMVIQDPSLAGTEVFNIVVVSGGNTTDQTDQTEILIEDIRPSLEIEKSSDKEQYEPGETGHYEVKVTQVRADATARNVIMKDMLLSDGARILPETLVVENSHGSVWPNVEVEYQYGQDETEVVGYTLFTGKDLAEHEYFTVRYDVAFSGEEVSREEINTARATADNLQEEDIPAAELISVGDNLQAMKTSDAPSGSLVREGDILTYTVTVKNTSETDTQNVLIKDKIPEHTTLCLEADETPEQETSAEEQTEQETPADEAPEQEEDAGGNPEQEAADAEDGAGEQTRQLTLDGQSYVGFYISGLGPGETVQRSFQVQVGPVEELDTIVNAAQVRSTRAAGEEVSEDTYRSGNFRYTNETVHFVDTLWVSTEHRVILTAEERDPTETPAETPAVTPGDGENPGEDPMDTPSGTPSGGKQTVTPSGGSSTVYSSGGSSSKGSGQKGTLGVDTGDDTPVELLAGICAGTFLLAGGLWMKKRKRGS